MRTTRMVYISSLLAAITIFSTAACAPAAPSTTAESKQSKPTAVSTSVSKPVTPDTVRVAVFASASDAAMFVAQDKGFFKEAGLRVDLQRFDTTSSMIPLLGTGQLDIGGASPSAGFYNAVSREIKLKVVADKGSDLKGFGYQGIVVRKDLASKVKDYKDLKGLKVAMTDTSGTSALIVLSHALSKGGLTVKDVDITAVPYPEINNALRNGAIDAAVYWEPQLIAGVEQGFAVDWRRADEVYPNHQSAAILYGAEFATKRPDVAKKWMVAYLKGVRYYNDAFRKGTNKAEVIQIIARHTGVKPEMLEKGVPVGLNPDGYVNLKGLSDDLDLLRQLGYVKAPVDLKQVVDNQYVDFALKQLGPYKP